MHQSLLALFVKLKGLCHAQSQHMQTTAKTMPRRFFLPLLLALLSLSCAVVLAQPGNNNNTDTGAYGGGYGGGYGYGDNTKTNAPSPQQQPQQQQPNVTQPQPTVATSAPTAPNATAPPPTTTTTASPNETRPIQSSATTTGGGGGGGGDNATAYLVITLNNNNSWVTEGSNFEQNNYLMQNTANAPICDVSIQTPLANGNRTRVYSSYNVDVKNATDSGMHFDLPSYLQKIWPGQVVPFGWILNVSKERTP